MRQIEFRCWNAFSGVMHSWGEMVKLNKIHLLAEQNPAYPVMQFTGLHDCDGVKIFEGDTASHSKLGNLNVIYQLHSCQFVLDSGHGEMINPAFVKVIGNIHEVQNV
jgi:hypothetical protein